MTDNLELARPEQRPAAALSDNYPLSDTALHLLHGASSPDPLVAEYLLASRADNTRRAYAADLRHFQAWGGHLPGNADEIARYVAHHATILKPVTLRRRLAALATAHKDAGVADPTKTLIVARVMAGIERRHAQQPKQVAPLLIGDLARIVARMGQSHKDIRDKALLLIGFFAALRRSELVALHVSDIAFTSAGASITIRRSKTDQIGQGRSISIPVRNDALCPVKGLRQWAANARLSEGNVFRQINARGLTAEPMSTRSIARLIKARVRTINLAPARFSGHSLRAGFATSAALAGYEASLIARQTGHRSLRTLATYIRP